MLGKKAVKCFQGGPGGKQARFRRVFCPQVSWSCLFRFGTEG